MSKMQRILNECGSETDLNELKEILMLKITKPHLRVGLWPDEWATLLACVNMLEKLLDEEVGK